ncbi:MAG: VWA domain-containing protein [Acidobacteriia bacterium]|nr:VWA domain-containing protein [Terriglobia bacterium]
MSAGNDVKMLTMKATRGLPWLLCGLWMLSLNGLPRQQTERIRVQTTLVNVPVMVSDRLGATVSGLGADDFVLYDDGIRQPLAFFVAAAAPIQMALVIDTSKSTTTVLDGIRKAAVGFVAQLRPEDQAMVVSFDSEVHILCRLGADEVELRRAVRSAEVGEYVGTKMCDAVALVANKYLRGSQGRKAIVLLTDGQDYGSDIAQDDMIRAVLDAGVVVYPVFYAVSRRELVKKLFGVTLPKGPAGGAGWEEDERAAAALLRRTAEESGGVFYRSESADFRRTFAKVAEELRHQYLLAFYPDPSRADDAPHTLTVAVSLPDLVVRARRSYRVASGIR